MHAKEHKGFSLIELMIVIAIIGILASIAVPSYRNYIKKAKMTAVITALESFKSQVAEPFAATGQFPNVVNGCPANQAIPYSPDIGQFFWNHDATRGWLQFWLVSDLGGGRIQLQAVKNPDGSLTWYCGFWDSSSLFTGVDGASLKYAPASCSRTDLSGIVGS